VQVKQAHQEQRASLATEVPPGMLAHLVLLEAVEISDFKDRSVPQDLRVSAASPAAGELLVPAVRLASRASRALPARMDLEGSRVHRDQSDSVAPPDCQDSPDSPDSLEIRDLGDRTGSLDSQDFAAIRAASVREAATEILACKDSPDRLDREVLQEVADRSDPLAQTAVTGSLVSVVFFSIDLIEITEKNATLSSLFNFAFLFSLPVVL